MKKLAILFLLTGLAFSAFAIEGVGDFEAGLNLEGSTLNNDKAYGFAITPTITFSRELIPGLSLFAGLNSSEGVTDNQHTIFIPFYDGGDTGIQFRQIDLELVYALAAGPGNLNFGLRNRIGIGIEPEDKFTDEVRIRAGYDVSAGPGSLSIGAYTGFSYQIDRTPEAFDYDTLGFDIGYSLDMGVSISTDTWFQLGKNNGDEFKYGGTWFQLGYANDQFGGGIEGHLMATYKADGDLDKLLLPLKPYFEFYGLYEGLTVGAYIKLASINANDIYVSPGVYAKFAF
jgi:hypothetical protein